MCCKTGVLQYRCAMLALLWRRSFPENIRAARTNPPPSGPSTQKPKDYQKDKAKRKATRKHMQKKQNMFSTCSFWWTTDIHFHKYPQWPMIIREMNWGSSYYYAIFLYSLKTKDNFFPLKSVKLPGKTWAFAKRQSLSIARPWRLDNLDRPNTFHDKWIFWNMTTI